MRHPVSTPAHFDADARAGGAWRERLRRALDQDALHGNPDDSEALQQRVMAQWQQRHPAAESTWALAGHAASAPPHAVQRRRVRWAASAVLALVLVVGTVAWQQRPDPALEELMQMDVLTLMSMGVV